MLKDRVLSRYALGALTAVSFLFGTGGVTKPAEGRVDDGCDPQWTPYATVVYGESKINGKPTPAGTRVAFVTDTGYEAGCMITGYEGYFGLMYVHGRAFVTTEDGKVIIIPGYKNGEPLKARINRMPALMSVGINFSDDQWSEPEHYVDISTSQTFLPFVAGGNGNLDRFKAIRDEENSVTK